MKTTSWKKAYAYVIGLNKYQKLSPLRFCEKDAQAFADTILQKIPNINLQLFQGNHFTIKAFGNVLEKIGKIGETEDQSVLFFYYAGHGFFHEGNDYLTCYDTQNCDIEAMTHTSISTSNLINVAFQSGINTVVMVFDACRSLLRRNIDSAPFGNATSEFSRRKGTISFFSCSPGEFSHELGDDIAHGIYTHSLIQAINESPSCTPVEINRSVVEKVQQLVSDNNLPDQTPFTVAGPMEKRNLDIISGNEISATTTRRPTCILIAGSSHAGKSSIGQHLTKAHGLTHYELSALVHQHYEKAKKQGFKGIRDDFLEYELCKNGERDFLVKKLLEVYDNRSSIIISGPRFAEEIEHLIAYPAWDIIPIYIHSDPKIRLDRYFAFKKEQAASTELSGTDISFENFIRNDSRQASWGLAKIATMPKLKMFINHDELEEFLVRVKSYTDQKIIDYSLHGRSRDH